MEVELTPFYRRHAGQTEVRSLVIVVPDELIHRAAPRREREERAYVQALVVDGAKEALDFAVGLRRVRPEQVMSDPHRGTGLLESGAARRMQRVTHREGKSVVRQH